MTEQNEPFFRREGALYQPLPSGRGPWNPQSLHGRVIVGLLAYAVESEHGDDAFLPARLTVDMYKLPGFDPVELKTTIVRAGNRIKVIDAEFISGGVSMGRATCQLLRRAENSPGKVWTPPNWDAPHPDKIEPPEPRAGMGGMWAMRPISGGFGTATGPKRTWMKEVRELVGGKPLTPFQRAALAADFASPFANAGEQGLGYINSDVTLYLHRLPKLEWIGVEVTDHGATDGVAVGTTRFYDVEGPIGSVTCCALAQQMRQRP